MFAVPAASLAQTIVIKTGDPAPGFGAGYIVQSIAAPPSISDGEYAMFQVAINGPGADDPLAIYRWHPSTGLVLVAKTGQSVMFQENSGTITFFETPIADEFGNVAFTASLDSGRGLITWDKDDVGGGGVPLLTGALRLGDGVILTCDTVSGNPCPNVNATIATLGDFTGRISAAFRSGKVFFRAGTTPEFGSAADAVWLWDVDTAVLQPIANALERADGVPSSPANFYQTFTNVANCGGNLWGLVNISQQAPKTVYQFSDTGAGHTLRERGWPPDMVPRFDFHCAGPTWSYAGSYGTAVDDTHPSRTGVWKNTVQVYERGLTPAPAAVPANFLGIPRGSALFDTGSQELSLFAAKLIGGAAGGKSGVFTEAGGGGVQEVIWELQDYPGGTHKIEKIYTVHVRNSFVVAFLQKKANAGGALRDAVAKVEGGQIQEIMEVGDSLMVGGQPATATGFRLLGRDFVDTVVTGTGRDGHLTAASEENLAMVIDYVLNAPITGEATAAGPQPRGGASGSAIAAFGLQGKTLDIDGNNLVQPLTDGLLVLRYLFGFSGTPLTAGAVDASGCSRCDATSIDTYLDSILSLLNIDGNAMPPQPLTDGLLVLRRLFGFSGDALINGAVGGGCTRCTAVAIQDYIATLQ
jgi:hypothetical protein